jgi:hypothetical protein
MSKRNVLGVIGLGLVIVLLLAACAASSSPAGGGNRPADDQGAGAQGSSSTGATGDTEGDKPSDAAEEKDTEVAEVQAPTATLEPQDAIPDILVVHPDAFDFEITEITHTYVYRVPMMVAETLEYMETELKALGWSELGKPTLMGHLATLNLQREGYRLNVSLQDNEHSKTTRVQMLLSEQ